MNTIKKKMLEELEKACGIVSTAARNAGISRTTHYSWTRENSDVYDPEYAKEVEDINESAIDHVESKLLEKINGIQMEKEIGEESIVYSLPPSDTAIIFFLKTKGRKRGYGDKTEVDVTTKGEKISENRPIVFTVDGTPKGWESEK